MSKFVKCLKCKTKTELPNGEDKIEKCLNCNETQFLAVYENNNDKGGITMEKEQTTKPEKKVSVNKKRLELAKTALVYLKNTLNVEKKDLTAVISKMYTIARPPKKTV